MCEQRLDVESSMAQLKDVISEMTETMKTLLRSPVLAIQESIRDITTAFDGCISDDTHQI